MRIVLLGPPGSGKNELSQLISEKYGFPAITVNGLLDDATEQKTEAGRLAREAKLANRVSDELLLVLLKNRISGDDMEPGFVLVDFPRDVAQASELDEVMDRIPSPLDLVIMVDVDSDELMERLVGRISCDKCGARYNLYINPPMVEGICDFCGSRVNRLPEDYEETISNRLRIYEGQVGPLLQYYNMHGKLRRVDGDADIKKIWRAVRKIIDATPPTVIETEPVSEAAVSIDRAAEVGEGKVVKKKVAKKKAAKKAPEVKAVAKKKASTTKKAATKKKVAKKPIAKKVAKKAATKKKAAVKKPASKVLVTKKVASKKKVAKKASVKKKVVKKVAVKKKPVVKKKAAGISAVTKKVSKKKVVAKKKVVPKKKVAKKATVKKTARKKAAKR